MTSLSLKSRPITAWSMLPSSRRESFWGVMGVMLSLTSWLAATAISSAQEEPSRGQRHRREEQVHGATHSSPLDRLRNRSAEDRWQRHRGNERWSPSDPFQRDWSVENEPQSPAD